MNTQHVADHSSCNWEGATLESQGNVLSLNAYIFATFSVILAGDCTQAVTSEHGPAKAADPKKKDRRNYGWQRASRCWQRWAFWPQLPLAHNRPKKSSSSSNPSRFRKSRSTPVNTSKTVQARPWPAPDHPRRPVGEPELCTIQGQIVHNLQAPAAAVPATARAAS